MDTLTQLGQNIQNLRKDKTLSQEKLAELAGVHRTYIGMVERGERNISILNLKKIALALKVNVSNLTENL